MGVDNSTQLEALLTNSEEWDPVEILAAARKEPALSGLDVGDITSPHNHDHQEVKASYDRFIRINGQEFSFDDVANAPGIERQPAAVPVQISLCQRVDSGVLTATGAYFENDDYPSINVEFELPQEKDTVPIMISRTEKPLNDGEEHALRTYCYGRKDDYFMFFDTDERPDKEVDDNLLNPSVTVSGDRWSSVKVFCENPYVDFQGYAAPARGKESLSVKIEAASKAGNSPSSVHGNVKAEHSL